MKIKKKFNPEKTEYRLTNWLKIVIDMIKPKNLFLIGGRGMGKTSDVISERSQDVCYEMPGGALALVGDTYMNLRKNVIQLLIEGWERLGWTEATDTKAGHFVLDKAPKSYFHHTHRNLKEYKGTISTCTGNTFNMVSMDRPSTAAGNSYVHLFGDEAKYFKESKLKKLTPAIRGDYVRYGHSPYYRGRTFTTDYPDGNSVFEDPWILRMVENMDKKQILDILDCAFILNEIRIEYMEAEESGNESLLKNIARKIERWESRLNKIRFNSTLFYIASSFVNADILTEGWFFEQFESLEFEDYKTSVLSMAPTLAKGQMFYGNLNEKHFYADGYNYDYYDQFGLRENITQSSRGLRYIKSHEKLEAGVDFGNMIGMVMGQEQWPYYRVLKNIHVLSPLWINDMGLAFAEFFGDHKHKELDMYYDRSGNNYRKQKQDFATKLKNAIERPVIGTQRKTTGWKVNMMSIGQGNITGDEEYDLMNDLMGEKAPGLPKLLIDQFECKELKSSLELAPMEKDSKGRIKKIKKSEKFPIKRLPMESTNYSDAFKYLICRKKYLNIVKSRRTITMGSPVIRSLNN